MVKVDSLPCPDTTGWRCTDCTRKARDRAIRAMLERAFEEDA